MIYILDLMWTFHDPMIMNARTNGPQFGFGEIFFKEIFIQNSNTQASEWNEFMI